MIDVRVQTGPIDTAAELSRIGHGGEAGALVSFTGIVRGAPGSSLELEQYPGMTERVMAQIAAQAASRYSLLGGIVIHRHGVMHPGEPIVLVAVAAPHRGNAFRAAEYLIDWLKTKAPFWKRETDADGRSHWVEARASDDEAAARWD